MLPNEVHHVTQRIEITVNVRPVPHTVIALTVLAVYQQAAKAMPQVQAMHTPTDLQQEKSAA